jgi:diketogulonate reductase-like aldo/keto reductase
MFLAISFTATAFSATVVHGRDNTNATNATLSAKQCASLIKCSRAAKNCDCPTGCTCKFPLANHLQVGYLNGYTINVFPKATATIDCTLNQYSCEKMVVVSDGDAVEVKCQGFKNCDTAKFTGKNIKVNCGENPNAGPSNTANVCNHVTCDGDSISVLCAHPSCQPRLDQSCKAKADAPTVSSAHSGIRLPNQLPGKEPSFYTMPTLSLGTAGFNNTQAKHAVVDAYRVGFRAVHAAYDYYNVDGVGQGLQALLKQGIARSELFVTAMTSPCIHSASNPKRNVTDPQECTALTTNDTAQMLQWLGVDYVDLLLLHGPSEPFNTTGSCSNAVTRLNQAQWQSYKQSLASGVAKSIGESNFCPSCLVGFSPLPSVNQIQWHVGMGSPKLMSFCEKNGIVVQAYSPLAHGQVVTDPLCASVGNSYNRTAAEVGLRYVVQHKNTAVVVKASNPMYLKQDLNVLDWTLSNTDMDRLNAATEPKGQQDGRPSWGCTV